MHKITFLALPLLLLSAGPLVAQGMGGGMGGMDGQMGDGMGGGGMGGGGMGGGRMGGHGGRGGGFHEGAGGEHRFNPPKPVGRERFDKAVTAMFREADANHDGLVTIDELRGIVEAKRDAIIRARFAKIDGDHNGSISEAEFLSWQRQMGSVASSDAAGTGARDGPVAEVIMPDLGHDAADRLLGRLIEPLSVTVITQANSNYDGGASLQEVLAYEGKRFDAADTDHDGSISFDEMRAAFPWAPRRQGGGQPACAPDDDC